ncbi:MAG TPA: hypothetical protein VFK72_06175, partial [Nevskia sp.]|nr:hypothetical protein [Nevskia sp.]
MAFKRFPQICGGKRTGKNRADASGPPVRCRTRRSFIPWLRREPHGSGSVPATQLSLDVQLLDS